MITMIGGLPVTTGGAARPHAPAVPSVQLISVFLDAREVGVWEASSKAEANKVKSPEREAGAEAL